MGSDGLAAHARNFAAPFRGEQGETPGLAVPCTGCRVLAGLSAASGSRREALAAQSLSVGSSQAKCDQRAKIIAAVWRRDQRAAKLYPGDFSQSGALGGG